MDRRYAVYATPARHTALARWGSAWLGRDAETGAELTRRALPGWSIDDIARITAFPRSYGLHATLKPPFRLRPQQSEAALIEAMAGFAAARTAPCPARLRIAALGNFLALVPESEAGDLCRLADSCVESFDRFRAPPSEAELARRRSASLSPREEEHLDRWGYPYVFDTFRFHITLSGPLAAEERDRLREALREPLAPILAEPLQVADVALFVQKRDAPFRLARRFPFSSSIGCRGAGGR